MDAWAALWVCWSSASLNGGWLMDEESGDASGIRSPTMQPVVAL